MNSGTMKNLQYTGRSAAFALTLFSLSIPALHAQSEASRLVLQNGRSVPLANLAVEGGKFVVKAAGDSFTAGQSFPLTFASHVSGEKPGAINQGVALLLMEQPAEALKALEPVLAVHKVTANVPGNYWIEAARAAVFAYTQYNEPAKAEALGKEISEATPEAGSDPSARLAQVLALPLTVKFEDRLAKLTEFISDTSPAEISAYASYFRAKLLQKVKRDDEALESYLSIGCLYPASGLIMTSSAEMNAAEILKIKDRREEAVALLTSAVRGSKGTAVGAAATKQLESLK